MDARSLYRVSPWTRVHDAHLPTAADRRAHTRTVQGPMAYRCVWGTHGYGRPVRRCILIVVSLLGNGHCFFPALAFRFLCAWPWCSSDVLQLTPPSFFSTTHRLADALVCLFVCSFVRLARRLPPSFHHTHTYTSPFVLYLWTFGTILLGTAVRVYNYVQGPVYLSIQRVGVVTGNFR